MIEVFKEFDIWVFQLINDWNSPFCDHLMAVVSSKWTWIPLYVLMLWVISKEKKAKEILVSIGAFGLLVVLTDQTSVHLFKETFQRYRPCHHEILKSSVHLLEGHCGGQFGFLSSHAANTAGVATLFLLMLKTQPDFSRTWILAIPFWVLMVGYSRIYAGVHYPLDVLAGIVWGILMGWLVFYIFEKVKKAI